MHSLLVARAQLDQPESQDTIGAEYQNA